MKIFIQFTFIFLLFIINTSCNREYRSYLKSKDSTIKVYIEPTKVDIDILFLRSISSRKVTDERKNEFIKNISDQHAYWFDIRLRKILLSNSIAVVSKEKADLILEPKIMDMGEVRAKVFLQGLSVGLIFGLVAGELSGKPDIGLAVFAWEVIEEIIIVYLLKSYFMITTVDLKIKTPEGITLTSKEFTSYSNDEYEESLPEFTKTLRENKVRGSLEKNAKDIADFLK